MSARLPPCRSWQLLCLFALAASACYARGPKVSTAGVQGKPSEDRVGIDDVFDVRVYGEPDLTGSYRVANDGTIDFPLAGRLAVSGLRTGEIQAFLVSKLREEGYLRNPQITVTVKERNSQKITVFGQVSKPGQVGYYPNMTIVDAIASAGGFTGIAAKNSVNLRREVGGKIGTLVYPV